MRFYPPAWVVPRAVEDDMIGGHRIPTGSTVIIPIHAIHHDERFWPNPDASTRRALCEVRPSPPRSAYLPFGGGRRVCIGRASR